MAEPSLLYILLGLVVLSLVITGLTLVVGWMVHRDMQAMGAPTGREGWCETCRIRVPDLAEHLGSRHMRFDDGRTRLWVVFEALSAVLVVTSLLVAIYSDSQLLRAVAGIALVVVVSAATFIALDQQ